jgi:hypothetical protein
MKPVYKLCLSLLLIISATQAFAQVDTTSNEEDTIPKKASFKIGVSYTSNSVYLGRTDTVAVPTISPSITYTLKSGLYFSGSLDYLTNKKSDKLDGGNIEAGYNYTVGENFEGGVSFTKMFYNSTSTQVSSSISSIINAYVDYDIADIITPALSVSYNIGKTSVGSDFMINPNISHDFTIEGIFGDKDFILISPEAGLNAGSQNYYAGYLQRKGKLNKKGVTTAINNYYDALGAFTLLDYELSAPVEYKTGKLRLTFTPTYAFANDSLPQSTAAEKLITNQIQASQPYKSSVFYFEIGMALKF